MGVEGAYVHHLTGDSGDSAGHEVHASEVQIRSQLRSHTHSTLALNQIGYHNDEKYIDMGKNEAG